MEKKSIHLCLLILFLSQASFGADAFPLIGIDSKGSFIEKRIQKKEWNKKMENAISIISNNTLTSLDRFQKKQMNFNRVDVGTYIKMSLGLGNIIKGSAEPYFKLFFKKN